MNDREVRNLKETLDKFGFQMDFDHLMKAMSDDINSGRFSISEMGRNKATNGLFVNEWHIGRKEGEKERSLIGIDVTQRNYLPIPDQDFGGLKVKDLERSMKEIDWLLFGNNIDLMQMGGNGVDLDKHVANILVGLAILANLSNREARAIHSKLEYNFFLFTPFETDSPGLDALKNAHLRSISIDPNDQNAITTRQAHNILDDRFTRVTLKDGVSGEFKDKWIGADFSVKDERGRSPLRFIEGSESFDLIKAIDNAHVQNAGFIKGNYAKLSRFTEGDAVALPVERNGEVGIRVFYADPVKDRLSIDQKETARRGFYKEQGITPERVIKRDQDFDDRRNRRQ